MDRIARVVGAIVFVTAFLIVGLTEHAAGYIPPEAAAAGGEIARTIEWVGVLRVEEAVAQLERDVGVFLASIPPLVPAVRYSATPNSAAPGGPSGCDSGGGGVSPIPAYITWRESHDDYCAVNGSSGAFGRYQFMPGTWAGACSDLVPTPSGQDECASRISSGGANLRPWAVG